MVDANISKDMRTITLSVRTRMDLQNKVQAIKAIRALTGMGLKDAKELSEKVDPGHSEIIKVSDNVLEPDYSENINSLRMAGFTIDITKANHPVRKDIAKQIAQVITYATMAAQYDISRALINVMETYCPNPNEDEDGDHQEEKDV